MKKIIASMCIVMLLSGCVGPWFGPGGHKGGHENGQGSQKEGGKDKPRSR
jgi:hypothetical protein